MIAPTVEPQSWPRRRLWLFAALVMSTQLALIFWLSEPSPAQARRPAIAPTVRFTEAASAEPLALSDPTLFSLPNRHGFSGSAWWRVPALEHQPRSWSEPPRWLPLPAQELGAVFTRFLETNRFARFTIPMRPSPELTLPERSTVAALDSPSAFRIEGQLASRRLLTPIELPAIPHTDILSSSVVQWVVDDQGNVLSAVLLPPGSGLAEADARALHLARNARFEPIEQSGPDARNLAPAPLMAGRLVIDWQAVPPPPPTNTPPAASPTVLP
jgi:hypothetical protein